MKLLQRLSIPSALLIALGFGATGCPIEEAQFSSIDGDKSWDSLSSDDRDQLFCEDAPDYSAAAISDDEAKRAGCYFVGAIAGGTEFFASEDEESATAACETAYDECLADDGGDGDGDGDCDASQGYDESCTFTVDEYQACVDERNDAVLELAAASCSDIDWAAEPVEPTDGACTVLDDSCE